MKTDKFIPTPTESIDSYSGLRHIANGVKMTKRQFKRIARACRKMTWSERGMGDYDCTGRVFAQDFEPVFMGGHVYVKCTSYIDC